MSNRPGIPAWQRASAETPPSQPPEHDGEAETEAETEAEAVAETHEPVEAPIPTEEDIESGDGEQQASEGMDLLEQASRFLEDETIRDAPRERKVAFLESKGVRSEDIEELLGAETQEGGYADLEEVGDRAWASVRTRIRYHHGQ
jgi:hypothetical protein